MSLSGIRTEDYNTEVFKARIQGTHVSLVWLIKTNNDHC